MMHERGSHTSFQVYASKRDLIALQLSPGWRAHGGPYGRGHYCKFGNTVCVCCVSD